MSIAGTIADLVQQAQTVARWGNDEARAQKLARDYRATLLRKTPEDLPQAQFLCILAAVLGRFARDMALTDPAPLADALCELVQRHASGSA